MSLLVAPRSDQFIFTFVLARDTEYLGPAKFQSMSFKAEDIDSDWLILTTIGSYWAVLLERPVVAGTHLFRIDV
jgi:hypothetical protein